VHYDPDHVGRIINRLGLRQRVRGRAKRNELLYAAPYAPGPVAVNPAIGAAASA
jgi:hypothetical protein